MPIGNTSFSVYIYKRLGNYLTNNRVSKKRIKVNLYQNFKNYVFQIEKFLFRVNSNKFSSDFFFFFGEERMMVLRY